MAPDWKKLEGQVASGKFPLRKLLGSTGYSAVFLTESPNQQAKEIAIKFISSGPPADSHVALLQRASRLSHPHLLRLLPGGRCQVMGMDLVFVVMEYAEESLGQVLLHRPLTSEKTHEMLRLLVESLKYIHDKGLAHSHIKPSNILSVGHELKFSSDTALPLGEPRPSYRPVDVYDAPEAATALVAAPSDVWSLGVTLVEVLAQHPPVFSPQSQADPVVPSTIPQPFADLARQCLRRNPALRWTVAQIASCLEPAADPLAESHVPRSVERAAATPVSPSVGMADAGTHAAAPVATTEATVEAGTAPAPIAAQPRAASPVAPEMWQDIHYTWVVLCKNYLFHMRQNLFFRHRIPLAYTDPFSPAPELDGPFEARCDDCGKTYVYKPAEVRRFEGEVPKFTTHPLF